MVLLLIINFRVDDESDSIFMVADGEIAFLLWQALRSFLGVHTVVTFAYIIIALALIALPGDITVLDDIW